MLDVQEAYRVSRMAQNGGPFGTRCEPFAEDNARGRPRHAL
ncbi:hypothetical protein [Rubricoccus marinus]|nr:hypothetical protein [Rubricoccus marinus]